MDYRRFGDAYYVRLDRNDEIIGCIEKVCRDEGLRSATFTGIGGCSEAEIQTFDPDRGEFESEILSGMLELINITGNVFSDPNGTMHHHAHAAFSFKKDGRSCMAGGHLKSVTVLYTAEIVLKPTIGGTILSRFDTVTGTSFWDFE